MDFSRHMQRLKDDFNALFFVLQDKKLRLTLLIGAQKVWIITLVILLLVPFAVIPLSDKLIEKVYRPTTKNVILGIKKTIAYPAKIKARKQQARVAIWCIAIGSIVILVAKDAARVKAAAREEVGDVSRTLADASLTLSDTAPAEATLAGVPPESLGLGPQGRYLIADELGRGAMGIVYLARDRILDRGLALKELPTHLALDETRAERFRQEARTLAQISHPGIVQVYDLFDESGRLFLAMELVEGGDLEEVLRQRGALPVAEAARYGAFVAEALSCVHARGIVHRDLKPANILMTRDGKPKITDFGIARQENSQGLTIEGSILGSPEYMSPEQASGRPVDSRADIYALGVILYRMFTGILPFTGDVTSVLAQQITKDPLPPKQHVQELPDEVNALILSLLVKNPQERASDLAAVSKVLNSFTI